MSSYGDELALGAMKKEHARLSRIADKAQAEYDEYMNVADEMLSIHKEFAEIVKSGDHSKETLKRLDSLKARSAKTDRIRSKDFMKLSEKQFSTERDRDCLGSEIQMMEFRMSLRQKHSEGSGKA